MPRLGLALRGRRSRGARRALTAGRGSHRRLIAVPYNAGHETELELLIVVVLGLSGSPWARWQPANRQVPVTLPPASSRGERARPADPADFTTRITNPWWPMKPGSRWVYRETAPDETVQRVVVTVLPRTKLIANGVAARVVRDVVTEDGRRLRSPTTGLPRIVAGASGTSARPRPSTRTASRCRRRARSRPVSTARRQA